MKKHLIYLAIPLLLATGYASASTWECSAFCTRENRAKIYPLHKENSGDSSVSASATSPLKAIKSMTAECWKRHVRVTNDYDVKHFANVLPMISYSIEEKNSSAFTSRTVATPVNSCVKID